MTIKELFFTTIKKCFYLFRKIGLYEPLPSEQQKNLDIFESEFLKGHSGMSTFDLLKKITNAFDNLEDNESENDGPRVPKKIEKVIDNVLKYDWRKLKQVNKCNDIFHNVKIDG
jgi:hypothetical protein